MVSLENELLRVGVLADKGTDVFEFNYKPKDMDFVWLTAGGVRNPTSYLSTSPDTLATFVDYYPGGWQEILPESGGNTPVMTLIRVDLPAPLSPIRATTSAGRTSKFTLLRA